MSKKYEDLTFTDDFMFCKILYTNPELCKQLLELILRKKIKDIRYLATQNAIDITSDGKGIRLDVYFEGDNKVYDIEMQTTGNSNLPKRTRYYQGMIDLNLIERGADYSELKETFIIFVCLHDPFKINECVYTFENRCNEVEGLRLGDESTKIFLNASGNKENLPEELRNFLDYLSGKEPKGWLATEIAKKVDLAVKHEEWRTEYMTLLQRDREKFAEGMAQGMVQGMAQGNILAIQRLLKKKMDNDFILSLGYTQEEINEAEKQLLTTV
mgnify:CR=1 FL=1